MKIEHFCIFWYLSLIGDGKLLPRMAPRELASYESPRWTKWPSTSRLSARPVSAYWLRVVSAFGRRDQKWHSCTCSLLLEETARKPKRNYKKAGASPGIAFVSTHEVF